MPERALDRRVSAAADPGVACAAWGPRPLVASQASAYRAVVYGAPGYGQTFTPSRPSKPSVSMSPLPGSGSAPADGRRSR
ncbi:MAG: hypothetical protein JWR63_4467 [Conexibacter sp.]|nr:hypothetical protein [Conexibacter sp.]